MHGCNEGIWLMKYDFVMITVEESEKLRDELAMEALQKLGMQMRLVDHLPVPDLD